MTDLLPRLAALGPVTVAAAGVPLPYPNGELRPLVPAVTVVVPTRNEAGNVHELLRRLDEALGDILAEILFVDDSDDHTPQTVLAAAARSPRCVRLLHRPSGARGGGLGGAVVAGFRAARAPWAVVLDGDLQHPPEVVSLLLAAGTKQDVNLVAASRYQGRGEAAGLDGRWRTSVSATCTVLTKAAFPRRLRGVSDPMSGFFAVRLDALDLERLRPSGYKVLLEILARSRLRTAEVAYAFQPRFCGESKATYREGARFLRQLALLRLPTGPALLQVAQFLAVGLTGVAVNTVLLYLLSRDWGVHYLAASAIATQGAIVWNFALIERLVLHGRPAGLAGRFTRFWLLNVALLPVQLALLALGVQVVHLDPVPANVMVLAVVLLLRYSASAGWVYAGAAPRPAGGATRPVAVAVTLDGGATGSTALSMSSRSVLPYTLRVVLPPLVTLAAFPGALASLTGSGVLGASQAVALLAGWAALWIVSGIPRPGEPDVHDRQLDVILGVPLLAAAAWMSVTGNVAWSVWVPLPARGVIALVLFLAGTTALLLGTRLALRLRAVFLLALLLLPGLTVRPALDAGLLVVAVLAIGVGLRGRLPGRRPEGHVARVRLRSQPLPKVKPALAFVSLTGLLLALQASIATPPPSLAPVQTGPPISTPAAPAPAAPALHSSQALPTSTAQAQQLLRRFADSTDVAERRRLIAEYFRLTGPQQ